jgi:uncharacterized protein YhbP (UPF0306 family)
VSADIAQRIADFLDGHYVLSLATSGRNGPHAASVFYARDGFALFWVSDPETQHSIEIEADNRVAATVAVDCRDFNDIRGLQICGRARSIIDASERKNASSILEARYPFLKRLSELPPALRDAYARVAFYRLEPERITLTDNGRGFGQKETLELSESVISATLGKSLPTIASPRYGTRV